MASHSNRESPQQNGQSGDCSQTPFLVAAFRVIKPLAVKRPEECERESAPVLFA
jgi:hypothetical protein